VFPLYVLLVAVIPEMVKAFAVTFAVVVPDVVTKL
jgi:hypothetical protein